MDAESKVIAPWATISSKKILDTRLFDVRIDAARCPRNGREQDFLLFNFFGDWVNVIALTPDNCLVMIRQFRHGSRSIELEIPGGLIDSSDTDPILAGERELFEETGYSGRDPEIIGSVCPNPALQGNTCYTVMVHDAVRTGDPPMEETEDIETVIHPLEGLSDLVSSGMIRHALVLDALLFYFIKCGISINKN